VDSFEKFRLMPGVIPALLELRAAGFHFVMVSNQDGLGTSAFPETDFLGPQKLLLQILESQGIAFDAVHIDPTRPEDNAPTRKPGVGMLLDYLRDPELDRRRSAVIGDRETDLELAENMGLRGLRIGHNDLDWPGIARELLATARIGELGRTTRETDIKIRVDLDATAPIKIDTGIAFFDHMLEQIAAHGGFALQLDCKGDLEVDDHHSVEDCALALGAALDQALGDRSGIGRYGFVLPMDESLAQVAIDLSGRPAIVFD